MEEGSFAVELQKQLVYWQEMLYLRDWTVELRISRLWEMADNGTVAQCEWYLQRKDAIIRVLHPDDLPGLHDKFLHNEECDYDVSIVHELLHLHFASFHNEQDETAHEQAINAISRGMVRVWRAEQHIPPPTLHVHVGKEGYL